MSDAKKNLSSGGAPAGPPSFPPGTDVKALERAVTAYLEQGAYISAISTAEGGKPSVPIGMPGSSAPSAIAGVHGYGWGHRFRVDTSLPGYDTGYLVRNVAGKTHFDLEQKVVFCPDGQSMATGDAVPPTPFDPARSQEFHHLDVTLEFDDENRLEGFGGGKTYPISVDGGSRILVGASGIVTGGSGIFEGAVGSYALNGTLDSTADNDACVQILVRLQDTEGRFRTESGLGELESVPYPDRDASYMTFLGEEDPADPVTTEFDEQGTMVGGHVTELLNLVWLDFDRGGDGFRSWKKPGPFLAKLVTKTRFNPMSAPGTAEAPFSFLTRETSITVHDTDGEIVGTIDANIDQGRGYQFPLPPDLGLPMPGFQIVGFGPINGGSGQFEGARGLFSVQSVISVAPAALYNMYVFRFEDPRGTLRG